MQDWAFSLASSAADIDADDWAACVPPLDTLRSRAFFQSLEQSGSASPEAGWVLSHAMLHHRGKIAAIAPLYFKSHSMGEYVFDQAWAEAFHRAGGRYYPKLIGCIPFTPTSGPRLWLARDAENPAAARRLMAKHIVALCDSAKISSAHLTFCTEEEAGSLQNDDWLVRRGLQYHWRNEGYADIADFLDTFNTRKRKMIKKERETAKAYGLNFKTSRGVTYQGKNGRKSTSSTAQRLSDDTATLILGRAFSRYLRDYVDRMSSS